MKRSNRETANRMAKTIRPLLLDAWNNASDSERASRVCFDQLDNNDLFCDMLFYLRKLIDKNYSTYSLYGDILKGNEIKLLK